MLSDMKPSPEDVLSRYPGPVELLPERLRWQIMLALSLTFVIVGLVLMMLGHRAGLWIVIAFGALALVPSMIALPGAAKLVLDRDGFRATSLYRGRYVPWEETSEFQVAELARGGHHVVVYEDSGASDQVVLSKSRFAGYNSALPDPFGMTPQELAFVLNEWRKRALADSR